MTKSIELRFSHVILRAFEHYLETGIELSSGATSELRVELFFSHT